MKTLYTDLKNKTIIISKPYYLTESIDNDIDYLRSFYSGMKGKVPGYS